MLSRAPIWLKAILLKPTEIFLLKSGPLFTIVSLQVCNNKEFMEFQE